MGFKAIHDQNPFIVPGIILSLLLILRGYFGTRPGPYRPFAQKFGRKSVIAITALLGICLVLAPAFEMYFRMLECRVSDQYMKENIDHAHKAMTVFQENNIPFWLDYATLLNQLRGQTLNAWEQDVDLSTIFPTHLQSMRNLPILPNGETMATLIDQAKKDPMGPYPALTVELLMAKLEKAGFDVVFENKNDRMLIQCWGKQRKGPHIDVWLWAAIPPNSVGSPVPSASVWSHSAPPQLWSGEERLSYNPREFSHIFPLLNNATWLGRTVTIPQDSHEVSQREFGTYGGSYMTPQVFRGDCFHNFFQFRFLY